MAWLTQPWMSFVVLMKGSRHLQFWQTEIGEELQWRPISGVGRNVGISVGAFVGLSVGAEVGEVVGP